MDLQFHAEGPAVTGRTLVQAGTQGVMSPSMPTPPPAASLSPANLEGFFESNLKDSASRYFHSCAGDLA